MQEQPHNQSEHGAQQTKSKPSRRGGVMAGWILVVLGVLFLLNNFYILDFSRFWPVLLIAIGIILLMRRSSRDERA